MKFPPLFDDSISEEAEFVKKNQENQIHSIE